MVSIIARPTNKVRDKVAAASGWRAIASMAAATARPSARAGPMAPNDTAIAAAAMGVFFSSGDRLQAVFHTLVVWLGG